MKFENRKKGVSVKSEDFKKLCQRSGKAALRSKEQPDVGFSTRFHMIRVENRDRTLFSSPWMTLAVPNTSSWESSRYRRIRTRYVGISTGSMARYSGLLRFETYHPSMPA